MNDDRWNKHIVKKERSISFISVWTCPKCRKEYDPTFCKEFNYCPNCGENIKEKQTCDTCFYYPSGDRSDDSGGITLDWPDRDFNPCPYYCPGDPWYSDKPPKNFYCKKWRKKMEGATND